MFQGCFRGVTEVYQGGDVDDGGDGADGALYEQLVALIYPLSWMFKKMLQRMRIKEGNCAQKKPFPSGQRRDFIVGC